MQNETWSYAINVGTFNLNTSEFKGYYKIIKKAPQV